MWLPSHPSQGRMIKVCDNLVLYHIHNYIHYDSYIYDLSVLIFERYPEKNHRSAGEINYDNSTHVKGKSRPRLGLAFFSVVRGNVLTACATRASDMVHTRFWLLISAKYMHAQHICVPLQSCFLVHYFFPQYPATSLVRVHISL